MSIWQLVILVTAILWAGGVVVDAVNKLTGEIKGARWQLEQMGERLQHMERYLRSLEFRSRPPKGEL